MSKRTWARKKGSDEYNHAKFFSASDMGFIRHYFQMLELQRKRRQEKYNKSSRRRKDGKPYQATDPLSSANGNDPLNWMRRT